MDEKRSDWIEMFNGLKNYYCPKCEFECTPERRLCCVEQFLRIAEDTEIVNDYHNKR